MARTREPAQNIALNICTVEGGAPESCHRLRFCMDTDACVSRHAHVLVSIPPPLPLGGAGGRARMGRLLHRLLFWVQHQPLLRVGKRQLPSYFKIRGAADMQHLPWRTHAFACPVFNLPFGLTHPPLGAAWRSCICRLRGHHPL